MSQMPDTHRVLLRTMLQYEIDNWIDPNVNECLEFLEKSNIDNLNTGSNIVSSVEFLLKVKEYLTDRIKVLHE